MADQPQIPVSLFDAEEVLVEAKVMSFDGDLYTFEVDQPGLRATFTVSDRMAHDAVHEVKGFEGSAYDALERGSVVWLKLR